MSSDYMTNFLSEKLQKILDGTQYEWSKPIPRKWGLREMITEIYASLPEIYQVGLDHIYFTEPDRLSIQWGDMDNEEKYVDRQGTVQYLRVSDILSIMNQYVNVITFDMNSFGYGDENYHETELSFEFRIEPYQALDSVRRTETMKRKLSKMKRQMRR